MNNEGNIKQLHLEFIELLKGLYGPFDKSKNKFQATSNSKIARDLFYSDSQFSRLINGTASEGEFERAVQNVKRSLELQKLNKQKKQQQPVSRGPGSKWILYVVLSLLLISTILLSFQYFKGLTKEQEPEMVSASRYEMLKWSFDNKYINPYTKLKELPDDCYFPCYKYQGRWSLKKEYKIPFFRERNGFHYVAKEATMYSNCMESERTIPGESFEGYEYQKHEIWYDMRQLPIDSFLVDAGATKIREDYNNTVLENHPDFVKIAYVHTFFRGEYTMDSTSVHRSGKVIGRDIEFIKDDELRGSIDSDQLLEDLKNEVNAIAQNRLEDLSKPINCSPAALPDEDFHALREGDELNFNCQFSTGRFLVDYNKVYKLEYQYINNVCR